MIDVGPTVAADADAAELFQPRDRAFDGPASAAAIRFGMLRDAPPVVT